MGASRLRNTTGNISDKLRTRSAQSQTFRCTFARNKLVLRFSEFLPFPFCSHIALVFTLFELSAKIRPDGFVSEYF